MKIIQYLIIFVFFGLISTGIAAEKSSIFNTHDNTARYNGIHTTPQLLMPRVYVPVIPESRHYLDHYNPDNYCTLEDLQDLTVPQIKTCFESKQRWLRL